MRVRITRASSGELDGGVVAPFEPRRIYDIRSMLGVYLIAIGRAERVDGLQSPHQRCDDLLDRADRVRQEFRRRYADLLSTSHVSKQIYGRMCLPKYG